MTESTQNLSEKIRTYFKNENIYKDPKYTNIFSGSNLPSFIKDWLVKRYSTEGEIDIERITSFLENHIPQEHQEILKGRLINEGKAIKLLTRMNVIPSIATGIFNFEIPDFGIKSGDGEIPKHIVEAHQELLGGETWGIVSLYYEQPYNGKKGRILVSDYKSFKPYKIDLNYWKLNRDNFTLAEWIDFMIRSMEYNPEGFNSIKQKIMFLSRLLSFVEPNLNLIELAPKGTGKSYIFGQLSKYGWLINGGIVSRAKLFYDLQKRSPGIVQNFDIIAMDEIQTIKFSNKEEMLGILKNYLESGVYTAGNVKQTASAGFILMGNIPLSEDKKPLSRNYFDHLPDFLQESAFLDRFHGFIEGWYLPRINESMLLHDYSLNVEYFTEILNGLRKQYEYKKFAEDHIEFDSKADIRDKKAIIRMVSGYLKLLFPSLNTSKDLNKENFTLYCVEPAIEKRRIIRQQINMIDPEYKTDMPKIKIKMNDN